MLHNTSQCAVRHQNDYEQNVTGLDSAAEQILIGYLIMIYYKHGINFNSDGFSW